MKKVIIVGAGPAGLFAAYKLAGCCEVTIIDKGLPVEKRKCPSPDKCTRKCKLCAKLHGEGGAGLISDGKLIFHTDVGSFLNEVSEVGKEKNAQLVSAVQNIFKEYSVVANELSSVSKKKLSLLEEKAARAGIRFVPTTLAHIGTDRLEQLIIKFRDDLKSKGVQFITHTDVISIAKEGSFVVETSSGLYRCDRLLLAPGRVGAKWLEELVRKLGIEYSYNPMDIGVRVEVKRKVTDKVTELARDMKFFIETETYKDMVRTFCTCPGGKVVRETHAEGYNLVNGHSEANDPYENTNFALLVTIPFTEPMANGNVFARRDAEKIKELGGDKPIVQRLGDLLSGRRSKSKHAEQFVVRPSLTDVTFGDIGLALEYRIVLDIIEGLKKLNRVVHGVYDASTLLYAPEAKFHALRIKNKDPYLQTNIQGLYVAGDGAGLSRGIVGAACCGILAGEGIIKSL